MYTSSSDSAVTHIALSGTSFEFKRWPPNSSFSWVSCLGPLWLFFSWKAICWRKHHHSGQRSCSSGECTMPQKWPAWRLNTKYQRSSYSPCAQTTRQRAVGSPAPKPLAHSAPMGTYTDTQKRTLW